jgi:hypothetical protein
VTAIADLLTRTERHRLLEHLDEREDIRRLMTEPGSLAAPDEPVPLHRARPVNKPPARHMDGPGNRRCATSGKTKGTKP